MSTEIIYTIILILASLTSALLMHVFDKNNDILGYKDSPLDCGKDAFLYLFRNRVML